MNRLSRRALALPAALTLTLLGQGVTSAAPRDPGLVVSEAYGGGGNSGATLTHDFVELYNPTDAAISLEGLSIQYRSASGSGTGFTNLSGSVPARGHWLVQQAAGTGGTTALPTPDTVGNLAMSGTSGSVALVRGTGTVAVVPGSGDVIDLVGYGAAALREANPAPATSSTSAVTRAADGTDTNDNSVDFTLAAPAPQNSGAPDVPTPVTKRTIAEIQGTAAATSPLAGQQVETSGVVTAAYPTGGLNGFYLQTAGTGQDDPTPGASDAVFVHTGSARPAEVGQYVKVVATVTEFYGLTELTSPTVTDAGTAPAPVHPARLPYPRTDAEREAHEGELVSPDGEFTVTNNYATNQYGEIGLASGAEQLWQPTDRVDARDVAAVQAVAADNAARAVTLDDGSTWNYLTTAKDSPLPWLAPDNPVRVGSRVTFTAPLILDYRNSTWKLQPTKQVTSSGRDVVSVSDTRAANSTPRDVGGDVRLATMNVLNYFNTTGRDWVSGGGACSYYDDRAGDPVTTNSCTGGTTGQGPRGAAESSGGADLTASTADLERQRTKIVRAVNSLNADIVSLEEVENSVALGEGDRDDALRSLVEALNADAGSARWAYVSSPGAGELPPLAEQDVIRTAFIYRPATVRTVGGSKVLLRSSAFANAREPLAQKFTRAGAPDGDGFAVIVNHFKSKGSGVDDGTGQGNANPDRVAQARALADFAAQFAADHGTDKVFLTGDFNAYTHEDPIRELESRGYTNLTSDDPLDVSYQFGGLGGSLDHVLASPSARTMVTGTDVWQVNAEESVAFEYSRYNYNATTLYRPDQFRASDHNPEIVGVAAPFGTEASTTSLALSASTLQKRKDSAVVTATVRGASLRPTGRVTFFLDGRPMVTTALLNGHARTKVGPFPTAGAHRVTAVYQGDSRHSGSRASAHLTVTNKPAR